MREQLLKELKVYIENFKISADNFKHSMCESNSFAQNNLIRNEMFEYKQECLEEPRIILKTDRCMSLGQTELEKYINKRKVDETFTTLLLKYIDISGLSDADIYKRAGVDRRHFSKIRCDKEYRPRKSTVIALCLALKLDEEKTNELLELAGYSLTDSDTGDLIIKFCIEKRVYDLMEVNEALSYFGQKSLGVVE